MTNNCFNSMLYKAISNLPSTSLAYALLLYWQHLIGHGTDHRALYLVRREYLSLFNSPHTVSMYFGYFTRARNLHTTQQITHNF